MAKNRRKADMFGPSSDGYQGYSNWDTWNTKLIMDNERHLYEEQERMYREGWTPEQIRDWGIDNIIGPHNAIAMKDAQDWNVIPEEERTDPHYEDRLEKFKDNQKALDLFDSILGGPDIEDVKPTLIDPELVNWHEIHQHIQDDFGGYQKPTGLDEAGNTYFPSEWTSKTARAKDDTMTVLHQIGANPGTDAILFNKLMKGTPPHTDSQHHIIENLITPYNDDILQDHREWDELPPEVKQEHIIDPENLPILENDLINVNNVDFPHIFKTIFNSNGKLDPENEVFSKTADFWEDIEHGDEPEAFYHAAPMSERGRIRAHGLFPQKPEWERWRRDFGWGSEWDDPDELDPLEKQQYYVNKRLIDEKPRGLYVRDYHHGIRHNVGFEGPTTDVWRIDPNYVKSIVPEHTSPSGESYGTVIPHHIPPEALTLHEQGGMGREENDFDQPEQQREREHEWAEEEGIEEAENYLKSQSSWKIAEPVDPEFWTKYTEPKEIPLYHATPAGNVPKIMKEGIRPWDDTGQTLWTPKLNTGDSIKRGNEELSYYAPRPGHTYVHPDPWQAWSLASSGSGMWDHDAPIAVFQVKPHYLEPSRINPDEDLMRERHKIQNSEEPMTLGEEAESVNWGHYDPDMEDPLADPHVLLDPAHSNPIAYQGIIPPEALTPGIMEKVPNPPGLQMKWRALKPGEFEQRFTSWKVKGNGRGLEPWQIDKIVNEHEEVMGKNPWNKDEYIPRRRLEDMKPRDNHVRIHNINQDFYHAAPTSERRRIEQWGLHPALPGKNPTFIKRYYELDNERQEAYDKHLGLKRMPEGVYMHSDPVYVKNRFAMPPYDIWRIPKEQIKEVFRDPDALGAHYVTHPVQPIMHEPWEGNDHAWIDWQKEERRLDEDRERAKVRVEGLPPEWKIGQPVESSKTNLINNNGKSEYWDSDKEEWVIHGENEWEMLPLIPPKTEGESEDERRLHKILVRDETGLPTVDA